MKMPGGVIVLFFLVPFTTVLMVLVVFVFPSNLCYIHVCGFGRISNFYNLVRISVGVIDGKKLCL